MATVTGFTAERMLAMEAATIVDGDVVGDNLILTRHDATTINAGSVRGPVGSPGITTAELAAILMPVGTIVDYIGTTPPTDWLTMVGQTIANGQTTYPVLWGKIPTSMKSGSSIVMPDTRGKVSVGYNSGDADFDAIGEIGGVKTHVLTQAELPVASITIDPPSTAVTGDTGINNVQHTHRTTAAAVNTGGSGSGGIVALQDRSFPTGVVTDVENSPHIHPAGALVVNIAPFQSGPLGSGAALSLVQPYVTFLKIIKAA